MYIPKTLQEENVHINCLMGLIFSTSCENLLRKIKFLIGIWILWKKKYKSIGSSVRDFSGKFEGFFFAREARGERRSREPRAREARKQRSRPESSFTFLAVSTPFSWVPEAKRWSWSEWSEVKWSEWSEWSEVSEVKWVSEWIQIGPLIFMKHIYCSLGINITWYMGTVVQK